MTQMRPAGPIGRTLWQRARVIREHAICDRAIGDRAVLLLASVLAMLSPSPARAQTQHVARGFAVAADVSMRVYVPKGRVRIVAWNRDSVHIDGTVGAASSVFGGSDRASIKFGVEPRAIGDGSLAEADLTVSVPRASNIWVKMTTGDIDAEGTGGTLELYAIGGSIAVRRTTGVISIESIDAAVTVSSSRGDTRVRGSKAPITLYDVTGTATVATVSGKVSLFGRVPECRIETIGGDILFTASAMKGETVELQTHAGAILITTAGKAMPLIETSSRSGVVKSPSGKGSAALGRIIARSFKGAITVQRTL